MKDGLERYLEAQKFRYDCAFEESLFIVNEF